MPLTEQQLTIALTTSPQQVVTPTTSTQNGVTAKLGDIYTDGYTVQADANNAGIVYVGYTNNSTNAAPVTLDKTNSNYSLNPAQGETPPVPTQPSQLGEGFALSRLYVSSSNSGDRVHVSYRQRILST